VSKFAELAKINVNPHTEKKNGLTYLSWAWAVDQLLRQCPEALWEYTFFEGKPFCRIGETCMVFCEVTAFGITRTAQLPVMDHRNKAIPNPDAFQVNVAMQRCLAKAIALHGIGLYIYAGEDLPEGEAPANKKEEPVVDLEVVSKLSTAAHKGTNAFREAWKALTAEQRKSVTPQAMASLKGICDESDADVATQI
jgi:hypothetical protein